MKAEEVKEKIRELTWEKWLQRHFDPLVTSFFTEGFYEKSFEKIGIPNMKGKASLFQESVWYESKEVWAHAVELLEVYLKNHTMLDVSNLLEKFYEQKKKHIQYLVKQNGNPIENLKEIYEILKSCTTFIWVAHALEQVFMRRLKQEVPKYVKKDVDKFIGDASFPKKKNVNMLMEEAMRKGEDPEKIVKDYGWVKVRCTFEEPFSVDDIKKLIKELKPTKTVKKVDIPKELQPLFNDVQELVYFRTARTDIFYELLFLSRPIFKRVAEFYKIPFSEFPYYTVQSLINGKPKKFGKKYSFAQYEDNHYFGEEPILEDEVVKEVDYVKGTVAYKGIIKGIVKIVRIETELDKVKQGDILVTQMTFPSFITAMHKASAFVTDEGGITCHAAIVSREMHKPCIIGTKIGTKVFKDGDLVEVDADKGIVRKL